MSEIQTVDIGLDRPVTVVPTELVTSIARVCYMANKTYCEEHGEYPQSWHTTTDEVREGYINGVKFRLGNPDAPPSGQHDAWMKDKLENGWVYGEVKDSEAKVHNCLVSYAELPEIQRNKDKLFCAIVDALK